jgi:hypothetical protein
LGFRFHLGPVSWGPSRSKESAEDGWIFGFLFAAFLLTASFYPIFGAVAAGVFLSRSDSDKRRKLLPLALLGYFTLFALWAVTFWYFGYSQGQDGEETLNEFSSGFAERGILMALPGGFVFALVTLVTALAVAGVCFVVLGVKKAWKAI